MNNIEEMFDLLNPKLITSIKTGEEEKRKARINLQIINDYIDEVDRKLDYLESKEKVNGRIKY
ncbi:MAG: hypothetical protein IKT40_00980 [Bacilli bacterium]|nr:hypothetical protein [Bacilli bacterium]